MVVFSGQFNESSSYNIVKKEANYAELSPKNDSQEILKELISSGIKINRFDIQRSTLNEIFLEIYGDENSQKGAENE